MKKPMKKLKKTALFAIAALLFAGTSFAATPGTHPVTAKKHAKAAVTTMKANASKAHACPFWGTQQCPWKTALAAKTAMAATAAVATTASSHSMAAAGCPVAGCKCSSTGQCSTANCACRK